MHRHPRFDLWLHDDAELGVLIGDEVASRTTVHQWPLSTVDRIVTSRGRRLIYKAGAPPTIEPAFYAAARSPLLVPARALPPVGTTQFLVLPEVSGRPLGEAVAGDERAAVAAADAIERQIAEIGGEPPVMADVGSEGRWRAFASAAIGDVAAGVCDRSFRGLGDESIARLRALAVSPAILAAVRSPAGLVHSDLKADNVLIAADGFRVIDWQRPIRGPLGLDRTALLLSLGVEATRHCGVGMVQLHHFLVLAWVAAAARRWIPNMSTAFDGWIADLLAQIEGAAK